MAKFNKALINKEGEYVTYGPDRKFVARFKHRKSPFTKAKFLKELIASHTVESYFAALTEGKAPLAILRDTNEDWYYGILEKFSGQSFR